MQGGLGEPWNLLEVKQREKGAEARPLLDTGTEGLESCFLQSLLPRGPGAAPEYRNPCLKACADVMPV